MAYNYRSAFVHEYHGGKIASGGGLNPLTAATNELNKWASEGYEPYTIQYQSVDEFIITYITFRKEV